MRNSPKVGREVKKMASQKDMLEIMGGHVFIFAHFLVPKSKLISYHFSFVEGCLQGCHCLLELSKESPVCPCFLISSQTRQNVHLHKHLNAKQGSVPKTNQQSQDSFVLFFFLNNCFSYFLPIQPTYFISRKLHLLT